MQTLLLGSHIFGLLLRLGGMPRDDRRRDRQPRDAVENCREQVPRDRHFGQLERDVLRVPRHLGPDLNELLS